MRCRPFGAGTKAGKQQHVSERSTQGTNSVSKKHGPETKPLQPLQLLPQQRRHRPVQTKRQKWRRSWQQRKQPPQKPPLLRKQRGSNAWIAQQPLLFNVQSDSGLHAGRWNGTNPTRCNAAPAHLRCSAHGEGTQGAAQLPGKGTLEIHTWLRLHSSEFGVELLQGLALAP